MEPHRKDSPQMCLSHPWLCLPIKVRGGFREAAPLSARCPPPALYPRALKTRHCRVTGVLRMAAGLTLSQPRGLRLQSVPGSCVRDLPRSTDVFHCFPNHFQCVFPQFLLSLDVSAWPCLGRGKKKEEENSHKAMLF